jgi:signal transduction histidine kinase
MAGAVFIPITYLHFLFALTKKLTKKRTFLIVGYLFFLFFFFVNFTPYFVTDVEPKLDFPFWPNPGFLYAPFLASWFFLAVYAVYYLINQIKKSKGIMRLQLRYILVGTIVGYAGGITNYFLWYDIPILPFGNWTLTFYLVIIAYAILKYHLLDIRVALTEFLVGAIAFILLIEIVLVDDWWMRTVNSLVLLLFLLSGYLLIKSVVKEIHYRQRLQRAYNELKKLDVAKTEFISIASHQLRTPLTIIKGYISMLLEGTYGKLSERTKRPLKNVYQSNERLIKLVNDLLTVSKAETGKIDINFKKTNVREMIIDLIEEMRIRAEEKQIELKYERAKRLPKISIDKNKIRQVLLNILDNAIRYTNEGEVVVRCETKSGKLRIVVRDTGEGMTKEEAAKVFNSFSRGTAGMKFWTEGVGLGLYVAKKFIELHKGKIWAKSEGKGKGSAFYIELPLRTH